VKISSRKAALKEAFEISSMKKGEWRYWFWIFFIDGDSPKPRQIMVLCSSKNDDIECNGHKFDLRNPNLGKGSLKGIVASWYFDGKRMNQNAPQECHLNFSNSSVSANSATPFHFELDGGKGRVTLGEEFDFDVSFDSVPTLESTGFEQRKVETLDVRRMKIKGKLFGRQVKGSAFFEKITNQFPTPAWFWGIFHFPSGEYVNYFYPYIAKKGLGSGILSYFDSEGRHAFKKVWIKERISAGIPEFKIEAENSNEKISFDVKAYSHARWLIKKKFIGIPSELSYNEFPAMALNLSFVDKRTGKRKVLKKAAGNCDHTTGLLL
jgi:hypothetical protein